MSTNIGIEQLPSLVHKMIGMYLTTSDLNNCCAVNWNWHELFGQDSFWKHHCNMEIIAYLKATPCQLRDIKAVMAQDPNIREMGKCRADYALQNQLCKNWIDGRYKKEKLSLLDHTGVVAAKIYDNDFLIITMHAHVIIYNIAGPVAKFITFVHYDMPYNFDSSDDFFHKITNDKFVISQNNLVKVFDISMIDNWQESFKFLFNKTEEESLVITQSPDLIEHIDGQFGLKDLMEIVTGDFYVMIELTSELMENFMHIWNIRTKKKLKVEKVPIEDEDIVHVSIQNAESPSDTILVECSIKSLTNDGSLNRERYLVYNLSQLMFLPISVLSSSSTQPEEYSSATIFDERLFVIDCAGLIIYDCNKPHYVISQYPFTGRELLTVARGYLTTFDFSPEPYQFKMLKIPSGEVEMLYEGGLVKSCYKVWDRVMLSVDCRYKNNNATVRTLSTTLWHFGVRTNKITQWLGDFMSLSKSRTRMLLNRNGKMYLLTFW